MIFVFATVTVVSNRYAAFVLPPVSATTGVVLSTQQPRSTCLRGAELDADELGALAFAHAKCTRAVPMSNPLQNTVVKTINN